MAALALRARGGFVGAHRVRRRSAVDTYCLSFYQNSRTILKLAS